MVCSELREVVVTAGDKVAQAASPAGFGGPASETRCLTGRDARLTRRRGRLRYTSSTAVTYPAN
jgi:hypothetical protein